MRKQIGFDLIVENAADPVTGKFQLVQRVVNAQMQGWEVLNTHVAQVGAGSFNLAVVLVRYEGVPEIGSVTDGSEAEVKRGPGRPKKVEEVVPA